MTQNSTTNTVASLFFDSSDMTSEDALNITQESLLKADDGELFLEHYECESLVWDDNTLKSSSSNHHKGFGLRSVLAEETAFAHSSQFDTENLRKAANIVNKIGSKPCITETIAPPQITPLYSPTNPINTLEFSAKIAVLKEIDYYIRAKEPLAKQVSVSLAGSWQVVAILRKNAGIAYDIRPLVRLNASVVLEKNGRQERGSFGMGGRHDYSKIFDPAHWQPQADDAIRQAHVNLEAISAPAGIMPVVLGSGWPGILLHEAIGHGLESDFNRKKTSAFSEMMGQKIASQGVTVVDDGTIAQRRGSLTTDDEGTKTNCTTLIEDGILKSYMHDRHNAALMGCKPTGNGRRESYAHQPMPRMTNTYMLGGNHQQEEMIKSVKDGIYAVNFGGGQVDITSGKFVFSASEAYKIEQGKVTAPVKGVTLIGNGPDVLTKIKMIGNDMEMDPGIGTCGKAGQSVPVGVGQPSLLIEGLTVGGTDI